MVERTLIDTDVLVDASRGVQEAVAYLAGVEDQTDLITTVVTEMELIVGCRNKSELRGWSVFSADFRLPSCLKRSATSRCVCSGVFGSATAS